MPRRKTMDPSTASRSHRITKVGLGQSVPDWYGWLGLIALLLLFVTELRFSGGTRRSPLLSLGEWLLLPLGAASLSMGLLALPKLRERTLLPLWLSAVVPGALWIAGQGAAMMHTGFSHEGGDLVLSWVARLIFPAMVFLPLLAHPVWRDRFFWTLAIAVAFNVLLLIWQTRVSGLGPGDPLRLNLGGVMDNQYDFGLAIAICLPLLAAWRGGAITSNRAFAMVFFMFLLPSLALSACGSWAGIIAALAGLIVTWTAWRGSGWILGIFVCLLVFGYGSANRSDSDQAKRELLAYAAAQADQPDMDAMAAFVERPFLGQGPDNFLPPVMDRPDAPDTVRPWYAALLGGSGLIGLGLWLVLLGELAARALGRDGRRDFVKSGGVMGATVALAAAGLWTNVMVPGAGALVGLLLAIAIVDDPNASTGRRFTRRTDPGMGGRTHRLVQDVPPLPAEKKDATKDKPKTEAETGMKEKD